MTSLYERWQENKDRPAWVRDNRPEIEGRAEVGDPIPAALASVDDWLDEHEETVTEQLKPTDDENNDDETTGGGDA